MRNVTVTRKVNLPASASWEVLRDFGSIYQFAPQLKSTILTSDQNEGVGTTRTCTMHNGISFDEVVKEWKEGEYYIVEISGFPGPLVDNITKLGAIPISDNESELIMSTDYNVRYSIFGKFMERFMMRRYMKNMMNKMLASLEEHVLTGKEIIKTKKRGDVVRTPYNPVAV